MTDDVTSSRDSTWKPAAHSVATINKFDNGRSYVSLLSFRTFVCAHSKTRKVAIGSRSHVHGRYGFYGSQIK